MVYLSTATRNGLLVLIGIPVLTISTKVGRIRSREEQELMADVRYKASFWQRGTDFTRELNRIIAQSVLDDPERAAALAQEPQAEALTR
jgi:hypothetical protein